jgi:lysophospholipase L1-like esterase
MRNRFLIYIVFAFQPLVAQVTPLPFDLPQYSFIQYQENQFEGVRNNPGYEELFAKFDTLIRSGNNHINIVHIGGSHIQADIYTHRIREDLQSFYPGILGSRGFFFPYPLAKTNSPSNLKITYTGEWLTSKNTEALPAFTLGLSGITAALVSKTGALHIVSQYDSLQNYDFNRIRIFCNVTDSMAIPQILPQELVEAVSVNPLGRYIQYSLSEYIDTLRLVIDQPDSTQVPFQLYGISLENDDPGVVYNTIGVNGARFTSYLKCNLFRPQLSSLHPDWVIISIGTNEGNTRSFDPEAYQAEYLMFLDSVRMAAPHAAILLTVPNDSYLFKRYSNNNTAKIREVIYRIAREYGYGVWDFYTIMGGLNSAATWYNNGLMGKDHIHFNKPGYLLKGDLFFSAFLNSWDDHLQRQIPASLKPLTASTNPALSENPFK